MKSFNCSSPETRKASFVNENIEPTLETPLDETQCGPEHSKCVYSTFYPPGVSAADALVFPPDYFCPNRAVYAVHRLAESALDQSKSEEVKMTFENLKLDKYLSQFCYVLFQADAENKFMALVIDKIFFMAFLVVMSAGSATILFNSAF